MRSFNLFLLSVCMSVFLAGSAVPMELVTDGIPRATIVTPGSPSLSATLAALELQYHVQEMTGVTLPVKSDAMAVTGQQILVGESKGTRALGIRSSDFEPTEYMIKFLPDRLVLIGLDGKRKGRSLPWGMYYMTLKIMVQEKMREGVEEYKEWRKNNNIKK